ncbi:hypothetical protein NP569_25295, partial [Vibrio parahaemolyticus]|nr:hypothetical protein [Vibrio parahaemolyticus]
GRLRALVPWLVPPSPPAVPASIPAVGTDPRLVRAWWAGLSDEERRWLVAHDPAHIGRLDGVGATFRDAANRIRLDDERDLLLRRREDLL